MSDETTQNTKVTVLAETERLAVGWVSEKMQRLQAQMTALQLQAKNVQEEYAKTAQQNQTLMAQIKGSYDLNDKDSFDVETGVITRVE
jgi:2-polyprenyl-3-methyl-5-hydroxy-6-metoxy-1,4-benzoquinol methylase